MVFDPSHVAALCAAIAHAQRTQDWVVVVARRDPSGPWSLPQALAASVPEGGLMCGRTALLPEGGRVTVAEGSEPVSGSGFKVMFLGYEMASGAQEELMLHSWRQAAEGVLTDGEHPGRLRVL